VTDGQHGAARARNVARATAVAFLGCASVVGCSASARGAGASPGAVVASAEQRAVAEYDLARDAFQSARLREALDHVEKSLQLDDNADAAYLGAVVLLQFCAQDEFSSDCRFKDAEKYAARALAAAPDHRDARNALGVILIHERRYEEAIAALKPLASDMLYLTPEKAWGNLGWAYLERGSVEEAIDALRRSVAAQPLFCVGFYRLGLAYEKKGDLALSREALSKAVDTERPECKRLQEAFSARARVLGKQGFKDEARADLERCREIGSSTSVGQRCSVELKTYQ
jgi:type IV pilus assembly protein PilF